MGDKRWPFLLLLLGLGGLGAAVVVLALDLRSSRDQIRILDARLRGLEEPRSTGPGAAPSGRIGNADIHVAPPTLDDELSSRVAEIEKRLAIERGLEGLPEPLSVAPPEERRPSSEIASSPPTDAGLPADRAALKDLFRELRKEIDEEDSRRERDDWQKGVIDGVAQAVELGPQQKDLVSQALQDRFREVSRLNGMEEEGKITEDEWEKQVYAVRKKADDQIRSLLSADQVRRFDDWKRRQRWYGLREGTGNG
ncbi:MAG: hypothetical protein AAB434_01875 [Planctomycetota bacterium]